MSNNNNNNNNNHGNGPNKPSANMSSRAMIEFRRFRSCPPYEGMFSSNKHETIDDLITAALDVVGRNPPRLICYPEGSSRAGENQTKKKDGCVCLIPQLPLPPPPTPSKSLSPPPPPTPLPRKLTAAKPLMVPPPSKDRNTIEEGNQGKRRLTQLKHANKDSDV